MNYFSKMAFIKSLASYYRQNFHFTDRSRLQSGETKAHHSGRIASLLHTQSKPKMAKWILGTVLTIILPFWQQKWRYLLKLEGEVDMVAEAVENVVEVVEEVAIVTEKMAEDAAESLPEDDHKLKDALVYIENLSKKVAEEAHLTQDIIHKVDEWKGGSGDVDPLRKGRSGKKDTRNRNHMVAVNSLRNTSVQLFICCI